MRDRVWILLGLAFFVVLVTFPLWHAIDESADLAKGPNLLLPATAKQCISPAAEMRSEHMQLLMNWREDVVRRNDRRYVAYDGKIYEKSLTHTCLGCHDKQQFCDRCHAYAGVSGPYCWKCHEQPQQTLARNLP